MPVVFDRYLRRKQDDAEREDGSEESDGEETADGGATTGPRLRRLALGVAVGAAIGWLLGRKRSTAERE